MTGLFRGHARLGASKQRRRHEEANDSSYSPSYGSRRRRLRVGSPLGRLAVVLVLAAARCWHGAAIRTTPCSSDTSSRWRRGVAPSRLQFDPAWFTTGLTASRAKLQDTGYGDVPNDNYVVEEGHRLLAYRLPANARITVLTKAGRLDSRGFPSTAVTPSQLAELLAGKEPVKLWEGLDTGFWMHVHVDTVCSLDQQYHP